jgi:hypothetical protein
MWITKSPLDCPYCGHVHAGLIQGSSASGSLVEGATVICPNCAGIVRWDGSKLVLLTKEQKAAMDEHPQRAEMEAYVESIVKRRGLYG